MGHGEDAIDLLWKMTVRSKAKIAFIPLFACSPEEKQALAKYAVPLGQSLLMEGAQQLPSLTCTSRRIYLTELSRPDFPLFASLLTSAPANRGNCYSAIGQHIADTLREILTGWGNTVFSWEWINFFWSFLLLVVLVGEHWPRTNYFCWKYWYSGRLIKPLERRREHISGWGTFLWSKF